LPKGDSGYEEEFPEASEKANHQTHLFLVLAF